MTLNTLQHTSNMRLSRAYSSLSDAIPLTKAKYVPSSGTYPKGFKAAGVFAGVKPGSSKPDLALVTSDRPCSAAAVFTKSLFKAPPVNFSRELLERKANAGLRSVIINSGNANSVTGIGGLQDAASMARTTDQSIGAEDSTLVMSTGVIGQRLPIQKILNQIPTAYRQAGESHENWMNCAKAICTTDTFPKLMSRTFELPSSPGIEYRIVGLTKGAGMISPNMATLLAIMATDAPVSPTIMTSLLRHATDRSFNSISVDNDPSSNDTVALLANGAAGGQEVTSARSSDHEHFGAVLTDFSADLAKYIVRDGEGATKFVTIRVVDAATEEGARQVARTVALSSLVKTALYGQDANWGRIVVAAGHALITPPTHAPREVQDIVPEKTSVSFVPADGSAELKLLVNGEPEQVDEARAREILEMEDLEILLRLGTGNQSSTHWTCDLSHGYVTINGDYRT